MKSTTKRLPLCYSFYIEGNVTYLELHAQRAPLGITATEAEFDRAVQCALSDYMTENKVAVFCLGRSGRHICIDDTPANRRRFPSLQRKALKAVAELWAEMRAPKPPTVTHTVTVTRCYTYEVAAPEGATDEDIMDIYADSDPVEVHGDTLSMDVVRERAEGGR